MFKAGSKGTPERYEGDLELEPLQGFVEEMVRYVAVGASRRGCFPPRLFAICTRVVGSERLLFRQMWVWLSVEYGTENGCRCG